MPRFASRPVRYIGTLARYLKARCAGTCPAPGKPPACSRANADSRPRSLGFYFANAAAATRGIGAMAGEPAGEPGDELADEVADKLATEVTVEVSGDRPAAAGANSSNGRPVSAATMRWDA